MTNFWINLSVYSALISISVIVGSAIPLLVKGLKTHLHLLLALSAGLMLGAAIVHLIPEALEIVGDNASIWILIGFVFVYLIEKIVTVHFCETFECHEHSFTISAILGICAHAFTDGLALGSGLIMTGWKSTLGFVIFLTIFFHKLPEAFAMTSILVNSHMKKSRIFLMNALLILMVPLGAITMRLFIGEGQAKLSGLGLAFSAGTFLHLSLSDLLPHVHEHSEDHKTIFLAFVLGLVAMVALQFWTHHQGVHL